VRDLAKKQTVTAQSLQKIEDGKYRWLDCCAVLMQSPATYTIVVRESEYDLPPAMLEDLVAQSIANFGGGVQDRRSNRSKVRDNGDEDDDDN